MSVALVTGGSRGIGRAIVEEFAAAGYSVAFTYASSRQSAEALAARLHAEGRDVAAYQADVRDYARAQEVVRLVQDTLGPITALVNNAGIKRDGALLGMDPAAWQEVIDTNLSGVFNYTRALIGDLIKRGGCVINVTSVSGLIGMAGQTNYSASKAGIIGFTKALAKEIARFAVRVNAIAPGFIDTDMTASIDPDTRKKLYAQIPARQPGTPKEVARLALYLASEDAAYVNRAGLDYGWRADLSRDSHVIFGREYPRQIRCHRHRRRNRRFVLRQYAGQERHEGSASGTPLHAGRLLLHISPPGLRIRRRHALLSAAWQSFHDQWKAAAGPGDSYGVDQDGSGRPVPLSRHADVLCARGISTVHRETESMVPGGRNCDRCLLRGDAADLSVWPALLLQGRGE